MWVVFGPPSPLSRSLLSASVPEVWQGAEGRGYGSHGSHLGLVVGLWGSGSGMTHREGEVDAEGCPSANPPYDSLQPGTEVKSGEQLRWSGQRWEQAALYPKIKFEASLWSLSQLFPSCSHFRPDRLGTPAVLQSIYFFLICLLYFYVRLFRQILCC